MIPLQCQEIIKVTEINEANDEYSSDYLLPRQPGINRPCRVQKRLDLPAVISNDRWTRGKALGGKRIFSKRIAEIQGCHTLMAALFEG